MIYIKMIGGLGNQMFQYALGRKLSIERKVGLAFDTSWYNTSPDRYFKLNNFCINGSIATDEELKKIKNNFFIKIKDLFSLSNKKLIIKEKSFFYNKEILSVTDEVYLDGYWQNPKYFYGIETILQKDFTLKEPKNKKYNETLLLITGTDSVSLHIRRGDYLATKNTQVYTPCTIEYYKNAVEYLTSKTKHPHLFIFSDDLPWVKENLLFDVPATFISDNGFSDVQELALMSSCKYNITANSSFSWWAGWLNNYKNKIVVTPKKWFIDDERNNAGLIPDEWIKL